MKSIFSPYNNRSFNKYLLKYVKARLRRRCIVYFMDEDDKKYLLDEEKDNDDKGETKEYSVDDVINSISLIGRVICFTNQKLINHIVYDLGQRMWYEELKHINNILPTLYLRFNSKNKFGG